MTDSELRDIYTRSLTKRADCPAPEALIALVTRTGSEESRLATLDHVMSCVSCKQDFELLRAITTAEQASASGTRRGRRSVTPWLAAAAVVLAAGALTLTLRQQPNPVRGAPNADIPLVGDENGTLVWRAIPEVVRYEVEVVNASGQTIFHSRVTDTTITLPSTLPTGSLSWWVRATLRDGSERRSAIIPIR